MGFLDTFEQNAVNDFVVFNLLNGVKMDIKGTNTMETGAVFALLSLDTEQEWDYSLPSGFKEGEGYVLTGKDKDTGHFAIHLLMTKKKSEEGIELNKILKNFKNAKR